MSPPLATNTKEKEILIGKGSDKNAFITFEDHEPICIKTILDSVLYGNKK